MIKRLTAGILAILLAINVDISLTLAADLTELGYSSYYIDMGEVFGTIKLKGVGQNSDIAIACGTYDKSSKLVSCTFNSVSVKSDDVGKDITYNCGSKISDNEEMVVFFMDKSFAPLKSKETLNVDDMVEFSDQKIYSDDTPYKQMVYDNFSIHMRSGVVCQNGEKQQLDNMPYILNDEYMVPVAAVENAFEKKVSVVGDNINIGTNVHLYLNQKKIKVGDVEASISASPTENEGVLYLPLGAVARIGFSKKVYFNDTTESGGMVIISDNTFSPPTNQTQLQALNDYLFYLRPLPQDIKDEYESSDSFGVHPRIMLTPDIITRLRTEVKTNSKKKAWYSRLGQYSRTIATTYEPLKYELRDGVRLLYVSDDFEKYMLCLGMQYQLCGETWYAKAAWKQIEAVASFVDWHPEHNIDVGVMATGFAIAYDWMYDYWTDEQKHIMEEAIYKNCFKVASETYRNSDLSMDGVINQNNINAICNCGISMSALAFMDVYPEICSSLVSDSVRCLEYMMHNFAPEGGWFEGPSYNALTIDYLTRMLCTMDTSLGKLFSLDRVEGLDRGALYLKYLQSDVSCYNFADADMGIMSSSGLFWLYHYFGLGGLKDSLSTISKYTNNYNDDLTQCILWYDVSSEEGSTALALDKYYSGSEIITMRNNFNSGQVFCGIKAGDTVYDHSHLDSGSFVYDAMGVRWAYELGKDNYNLSGYFSKTGARWNIFRLRPEAHNTVIINPDSTPGFQLGARADVISFESGDTGTKTVVDMSKVLATNATKAKRGFLFTDDRTSIVVRDEITLKKSGDVYWLMYIKANATINGNTVTLSDVNDSEKSVLVEFLSSADGSIYVEPASPFPSSPVVKGQSSNSGYYRLVYKAANVANVNITAKITPVGSASTPIGDYNTSIDNWQIK